MTLECHGLSGHDACPQIGEPEKAAGLDGKNNDISRTVCISCLVHLQKLSVSHKKRCELPTPPAHALPSLRFNSNFDPFPSHIGISLLVTPPSTAAAFGVELPLMSSNKNTDSCQSCYAHFSLVLCVVCSWLVLHVQDFHDQLGLFLLSNSDGAICHSLLPETR